MVAAIGRLAALRSERAAPALPLPLAALLWATARAALAIAAAPSPLTALGAGKRDRRNRGRSRAEHAEGSGPRQQTAPGDRQGEEVKPDLVHTGAPFMDVAADLTGSVTSLGPAKAAGIAGEWRATVVAGLAGGQIEHAATANGRAEAADIADRMTRFEGVETAAVTVLGAWGAQRATAAAAHPLAPPPAAAAGAAVAAVATALPRTAHGAGWVFGARILGGMGEHGGAECDDAAEHPAPANRPRGQIESVSIHGSSLWYVSETALIGTRRTPGRVRTRRSRRRWPGR